MRLCIVSQEYPPWTRYSGGIGTQYSALAPALARLGHDVAVLTIADSEPGTVRDRGVDVHRLAHRRPPVLAPLARALEVARALRRLPRVDCVLAPEWGGEAWRVAHSDRTAPLVTNLHGSFAQILALRARVPIADALRPIVALQRGLERDQAVRSDAILAPSEVVLASAQRRWPLEGLPSAVLPNVLDVDRVRRLASGPLPDGFPHARPVIAFSGRLERHKGPQVLVAAMRRVWPRLPVEVVLMGADVGVMARELRALAGEAAARLHVLGPQPPERLFPALAAADVVVLPSRWEAFGLAGLEALALGRAAVLTSGTGFEEFAVDRHNALLVPRDEPDALAAAIVELLEDPGLRERLGTAGAATADRHHPDAVAPRYADWLAQLA